MPEAQQQYISPYYTPHIMRYIRTQFIGTGVNNWDLPPAQNPDSFFQLNNVLPITQNILSRRWGYQTWNTTNAIEAQEGFVFRNNATNLRYIIFTATDGSGSASATNNINVYNENGGFVTSLFTPSANAAIPFLVNSNNYAYFSDGVVSDLKKWDGNVLTNWGIVAPISAPQINPVSTITTAWQASTMYTTMGLLVDSNNNVEQLVSVNNLGNNSTQYGNSGNGQPPWNNAVGATTTDGSVTWTSLGAIKLWSQNTTFNQFEPIFDPVSGAIFTASPLFGTTGVTGATRPAFQNVPVNNTKLWTIVDGTVIWACVGTPVLWKGNTTYAAWWEHANTAICEPILPTYANLTSGQQNIYLQVANANGTYPNFTGASATTGLSATSHPVPWPSTAGTLTADNQLLWVMLGPKGWQANHAYNQWSSNATPASAIVDSNGNWQVVVASTGNSGSGTPTWATSFGTTTPDGSVTWVCVGTASHTSTWAANTIWYLPAGGFFPPQTTSSESSAVIKDSNNNAQFVIAGGLSGGSAPSWNVSTGGTTTDNQITWKNNGAVLAVNGNISLSLGGRIYFAVFRNDVSGEMSDLSPASPITGNLSGDIVVLNQIPVSPDSQVSSVYILGTADGGDETTLYFVGSVLNGTTTFTDNMSEDDLLQQNIYQQTDQFGNLIGVANNVPPLNGSFPILHRGRIYMILGTTLIFSKALSDLVTSTGTVCGRFESAWDPSNQINLPITGGIGRGIASDGSVLYIGTERQILRLIGDGPSNYQQPEVIFTEAGILNQQVWKPVFVQEQPVGMMWMTPDFRVIGSDFNTFNDAGHEIQGTLNTINPNAAQKSWAMFVSRGAYDLYILAIPTGTSVVPNTFCVYNMNSKRWVTWTLADSMFGGVFNIDVNGNPRWIFSALTGILYEMLPTCNSDRFNNAPVQIPYSIQSTWLTPFDSSMRKLLNELQVITGDPNMLVTITGANTDADFNNPVIMRSQAPLVRGPFSDLLVPLLGAPNKFRWFQLTMTGTTTVSDLLTGFSLQVIPFNAV